MVAMSIAFTVGSCRKAMPTGFVPFVVLKFITFEMMPCSLHFPEYL
jgi:hypothetical protein